MPQVSRNFHSLLLKTLFVLLQDEHMAETIAMADCVASDTKWMIFCRIGLEPSRVESGLQFTVSCRISLCNTKHDQYEQQSQFRVHHHHNRDIKISSAALMNRPSLQIFSNLTNAPKGSTAETYSEPDWPPAVPSGDQHQNVQVSPTFLSRPNFHTKKLSARPIAHYGQSGPEHIS